MAAGRTYYEVRQALGDMGLDDAALARYGIRLLKLGMLFPLETGIVRDFARGLEEIVVVEEKRPFLEPFIRDALYDQAERPRVVGKRDEQGRALFPAYGELDADLLLPLLIDRLARRIPREQIDKRAAFLRNRRDLPVLPLIAGPGRHAHSLLLLGLPAQPLDRRARWLAGGRRDRLPRPGPLDGPQHAGPGAYGRRGRAVGRHRALHRDAAPVPEHRRRHLLPLRLAGRPPGDRRRHQHHLQDLV